MILSHLIAIKIRGISQKLTVFMSYMIRAPSIFYTRLIRRSGGGGAGAYPSGHWARGGVHPGQVASPSQSHTETNNHARSHSLLRTILESPINLTCMFLDGGRKPEYPEKTHPYTGRFIIFFCFCSFLRFVRL